MTILRERADCLASEVIGGGVSNSGLGRGERISHQSWVLVARLRCGMEVAGLRVCPCVTLSVSRDILKHCRLKDTHAKQRKTVGGRLSALQLAFLHPSRGIM